MAYTAVSQSPGALEDESHLPRPTPSIAFQPLPRVDIDNSPSPGLFMDHQHEPELGSTSGVRGLGRKVQSILVRSRMIYDVVEGDDDCGRDSRSSSPVLPSTTADKDDEGTTSHPGQDRPAQPTTTSDPHNACGLTPEHDQKFLDISAPGARRITPNAPFRSSSGRRAPLRHPVPDLQTLQGAYMANVEHLEKTAEKLSMTSSIEDAIRQMHDEQKKSDSRRSSLLASPIEMPLPQRQFSNASSVNSVARSGGFSPGGFNVASPRDIGAGSMAVRSSSKGSKFGSLLEPEMEGRPLDSFVNFSLSGGSPALSFAASIPRQEGDHESELEMGREPERGVERNEPTMKMTRPTFDPPTQLRIGNPDDDDERPPTAASHTTFDQAQKVFSDFDGEHFEPLAYAASESARSASGSQTVANGRVSSGNRMTMARPTSYADPGTGQQMLYYPAPVPMMLNLPPKISRLSQSEAARAKRRSQVLSTIPAANRQSAVWLPDVLEDDGDTKFSENGSTQKQEYMAQHQRTTMGGRRSTQDLQHLPPQLRASAFFDIPGPSQLIEVKESSAVKTLDSILDASAFAPVSAFTDHLIAGRLGAEVYGNKRASRPMNAVSEIEGPPRRKSFANLLKPDRASSTELLGNERRRFTMSSALGGDGDRSEDENDEELDLGDGDLADQHEEDKEDDEEDELYTGAPTTLLAELQLRKQRQKERTKPVASAYPNGMHSTLLELDAVAQLEKKSRNLKRVNLAWEDPKTFDVLEHEDDEDVPLAMLFPSKSLAHQDLNRPMGLMEKREMEDNEPLSRRRDRLQGKPRTIQRASTMVGGLGYSESAEDEIETLAQRVQRLKAQGGTATGLPAARPVSGDFSSELLSQFGGDLLNNGAKDKAKEMPTPPEEEETLGQRRKRLQAEREAREKEVAAGSPIPQDEQRPELKKRHSMADILTAHPAAGAGSRTSSYGKPVTGLLGLHAQQSAQRSSTMLGQQNSQLQIPKHNAVSSGFNAPRTQLFDGPNTMNPGYQQSYQQQSQQHYQQAYQQPYQMIGGVLPFSGYQYASTSGYPLNMQTQGYPLQMQNPMAAQMLQMQQTMAEMGVGTAPLNKGQVDMVERWRQSVMP